MNTTFNTINELVEKVVPRRPSLRMRVFASIYLWCAASMFVSISCAPLVQVDDDDERVDDDVETYYLECIDFDFCVNVCGETPYSNETALSLYQCATACEPPSFTDPEHHAPWATSCAGVVHEPGLCEESFDRCMELAFEVAE